jgi:TolB-like protein/DNA-binding winged helix-turn-helix (wHTH) protein
MSSKPAQRTVKFGAFLYDPASGRLLEHGRFVALTPKAFETLGLLLASPGRLVTREEFVRSIWPGVVVEDGNLTSTIWMIRRALGDCGHWVETIPRRGYRFTGPVEATPAAEPVSAATNAGEGARPPSTDRRPAWLPIATLCLIAAAVGLGAGPWIAASPRPARGRTLAVLPFDDLSPGQSQPAIAAGLTESIITELARNPTLVVTARASSTILQGAAIDEAARMLHGESVVRGTVTRAGDDLRVTLQIIDSRSGRYVWASAFDGRLGDVLGLERRIATAIASAVNAGPVPPARRRITVSAPAQESYLLGRELYYRGINEPYPLRQTLLERAIDAYAVAIARAPEWANPYAGIAQASHWMAETDPERLFPAARVAAQRAIALDPEVAEGHGALGYVSAAYFHNLALAEREFQRAIALDPGTRYRHGYGMLLTALGRADEATAMFGEATRRDPLAVTLRFNAANSLFGLGRFEDALAAYQAIDRDRPGEVAESIANSLAFLGRADAALAVLDGQRADESSGAVGPVAVAVCAMATSHRLQEARRRLAVLDAATSPDPWNTARAYGCAGDVTRALLALGRAESRHQAWLIYANVDAAFAGIRHDPRFRAFLARQGIDSRPRPASRERF